MACRGFREVAALTGAAGWILTRYHDRATSGRSCASRSSAASPTPTTKFFAFIDSKAGDWFCYDDGRH
jgi:hypothetical protein